MADAHPLNDTIDGTSTNVETVLVESKEDIIDTPPIREVSQGNTRKSSILFKWFPWIVILLLVVIIIVLASNLGKEMRKNADKNDCLNNDNGLPTNMPSNSPTNNVTPKNMIIFIGDGMGSSQHVAYRKWKKYTKSVLDDHYIGKYDISTIGTAVTDSANGAYAISTGNHTVNGYIGVDEHANPQANIAQAAKLAFNKGIGIVTTTNVYDATPAVFCAHALIRRFYGLIALQQAIMNKAKAMVDILFGGGRQYFIPSSKPGGKRNDGFDITKNYSQNGWNSYIETNSSLHNLGTSDLPSIGLFTLAAFPYYLDRKTNNDGTTPNIMDMVTKAIELLSEKYADEGFLLMVESARIDHCGHDNDIACLLHEMDEYAEVAEYIYDWARMNGETMVINLADHETGGVTVGRSVNIKKEDVRKYYPSSGPPNFDIKNSVNEGILYNQLFLMPNDIRYNTSRLEIYNFFPEYINEATHTAEWIYKEILNSSMNINDVYTIINDNYVGNSNPLSIGEQSFIKECFDRDVDYGYNSNNTNPDNYKMMACILYLLNYRTYTGWTTHGHTGHDCSIYGYGPGIERFMGHHNNGEIGLILNDIFNTESKRIEYTKELQQRFLNGDLILCDPTDKQSFIGWETNVSYPDGNIKGGLCVQEWK